MATDPDSATDRPRAWPAAAGRRIAVVAVGSRGDAEPLAALGGRLAAEGHAVRLVTHAEFAALARAEGIGFAEAGRSPMAALRGAGDADGLTSRNPLEVLRRVRGAVADALADAFPRTLAACAGADLILAGTLAVQAAPAARALGVPVVDAHLQPVERTGEFPAVTWPWRRSLGDRGNRATHRLGDLAFRQLTGPPLREIRRATGPLGAAERRPPIVLYGFSRSVVPVPADWPSTAAVTGYWRPAPSPDWTPPDRLVDFLAAGPPPVYLGFGSMPSPDPADRLGDLIGTALRRSRRRAVVLAGATGLAPADSTDELLVTDPVPHGWLLPRCSAAVHHCGAGTTAAVLVAGIPSVPVPHLGDQGFWAARLLALGVGTRPIRRRRLTADGLAAAIGRAATDRALRRAGRRIAGALAEEDGTGTAVAALAPYLGTPR